MPVAAKPIMPLLLNRDVLVVKGYLVDIHGANSDIEKFHVTQSDSEVIHAPADRLMPSLPIIAPLQFLNQNFPFGNGFHPPAGCQIYLISERQSWRS